MSLELLTESLRRWLRHQAPTLSAAMAFYALMSIAPLMVIVVGLVGRVLDEEAVRAQVVYVMTAVADPQSASLVAGLLEQPWFSRSDLLGSAAALLMLFFASTAAFDHLRSSLNRIWEVEDTGEQLVRNALRGRALAFGIVLLFGVTILVSLLVRTGLFALGSAVEAWIPIDFILLQFVEFALFFVILAALFTLIFRYLPDRRTPWGHLLVGAGITSGLFLVGEVVIGLYLGRVSIASAFGAAGSTVVLAAWVYYSSMVFLWGAELTHLYAVRRADPLGDLGGE